MRYPFDGSYPVTQKFGESKGAYKYKCRPDGSHNGVDFGTPIGTQIRASMTGVVNRAGMDPTGYGLMVMVKHPDGSACIYAHLSKVTVMINEPVMAGDLLGLSGNTGNSTGPHLHWEYRKDADQCTSCSDPMAMILGEPAAEKVEGNKVKWASLNVRNSPGLAGTIVGQVNSGLELNLAPGGMPIEKDGFHWIPVLVFVAKEGLE